MTVCTSGIGNLSACARVDLHEGRGQIAEGRFDILRRREERLTTVPRIRGMLGISWNNPIWPSAGLWLGSTLGMAGSTS